MAGGVYQNRGIRIEGLPQLNARLRAAGDDSQDMPDLMHRIGNIVIANARPPRKSGELAATQRAGRGKTKAVVRAGYKKRGGYAGVTHYGTPDGNIKPRPWLVISLRKSAPQIITELSDGIDQILRKNKLK